MLSGIYIYTHDTNPRELWARYQRPTDFSFNWVFFQRSPLFGGNIGSKTGFLLGPRRESNSTTPNPSYLQREWRADISLVNQRFIYIYICFLVLLLLLLRSLFTAQRRRSIALLPSLCWENVKIVSINVSMKQGGIEEKVGTDVWIIRIEIRSFEFTIRWRSA